MVVGSNESAASGARSVTILGSTGSIGTNTIDLIENGEGCYRIAALTAHQSAETLVEQARRLKPEIAVIADPAKYSALKEGLAGTDIEIAAGPEALVEAAQRPSDFVMAGIVGYAGLAPTLAAVRRGVTVGLANKECLVCAGDIVMAEVEQANGTLLPVDSEHSAIFQVFEFDQAHTVSRVILTASGGPFLNRARVELTNVTPAQAVAHPNWDMGAKISVDSATMMNKGLEVIEAHHLFPVEDEKIEIVVHPQSVIHSMVEYVDGSVLAQLGTPDMRTPIAYALGWPSRISSPSAKIDFMAAGDLTFQAPDDEKFPAIRLARTALEAGGSMPVTLNAANEIAVRAFLDGEIGFLDITDVIDATLDNSSNTALDSLDTVVAMDIEGRRLATEQVKRISNSEFNGLRSAVSQ
ncbi:MAG: 1-deoxy-D-xylulose-5-phosphate reductoisomerase [Alphaproteobacteria bacterium]|nr:1-deoxy-D-xylulose-5-phosphate reductoisomerase [Alphaproteobacteria bacterium]